MERKTLPVQLKAEDGEGAVTALFSTFNVIDHDGDVVLPGAFSEQDVPIGGWNHSYEALPVGKGRIVPGTDGARLDGQLFLDTTHGADMYGTLKGLGDAAEWSYVFNVLDAGDGEMDGRPVRFLKRIDVWSVDPVTRAAGIGTRTEAIKSYRELPYHDHAERVIADAAAFLARTKSRRDFRAADGRSLSDANWADLESLMEAMKGAEVELESMLAERAPETTNHDYLRLMTDSLALAKTRMAALKEE